jgi:hypothetical protein
VRARPALGVGGLRRVFEFNERACGLARTFERNVGATNAWILEFFVCATRIISSELPLHDTCCSLA